MLKQTPDDKEISITNAYSLFVYAIRTQILEITILED